MQKSTKILSICQIPLSLMGLILFAVGLLINDNDNLLNIELDDIKLILIFIASLLLTISMLPAIVNGILGRKENFNKKLSGKTFMIVMIVISAIGLACSIIVTKGAYDDMTRSWLNLNEAIFFPALFVTVAIALFHVGMSIAVLVLGKKTKKA